MLLISAVTYATYSLPAVKEVALVPSEFLNSHDHS